MGANQSAVYASKVSNEVFEPKKSGQVLSFRSSVKWKNHFQASKETNKLMVIHFTAAWCGPCRTMDPISQDFAASYADVEFIKIDVDELEDVAREYAVQALPAFILRVVVIHTLVNYFYNPRVIKLPEIQFEF